MTLGFYKNEVKSTTTHNKKYVCLHHGDGSCSRLHGETISPAEMLLQCGEYAEKIMATLIDF